MPNTYTELKKTVLGSSASTITLDNIPQGYTDLVLVFQCSAASANMNWDLRVGNGTVDSGSNYSATYLVGGSGGASSNRVSNQDRLRLGFSAFIQSSGGVFTAITQFMNYSNTTTNKTVISRDGNVNQSVVEAAVGLWRSTAAINIITMGDFGGSTMAAGTTVSLYGIANADQGSAKATGGIITEDSQYWYHTFGASSAFIPKQSLTCDVLVLAGGGGGAGDRGGGGGAGGFRTSTGLSVTATTYNVTVGGGGAGGGAGANGTKGSNSVFSTITSTGGGFGGGTYASGNGGTGGSGGGGRGAVSSTTGGAGNEGSYSPVEGFAGGNENNNNTTRIGGGGGGGSEAGNTAAAGRGGNGATSSFTGVSVVYAGGGGAGSLAGGTIAGGTGGGGQGVQSGNGSAGTVNLGGGGGGSGDGATTGAAGGSGVVVIRYAK
jgi:hypothetical protein